MHTKSTSFKPFRFYFIFHCIFFLAACSNSSGELPTAPIQQPVTSKASEYQYLIGTHDELQIFVWRNPDISGTFKVRPDGKITTSLAEDIDVVGKTPTQVARILEEVLAKYLRDPIVTVTVNEFVGPFSEQVRVVGEATQPRALYYRKGMTLLDVMIMVGGLTTFADGDSSVLVRVVDGEQKQFELRIDDLIRDGDLSANVNVLPGDVIIIPETWF